MFLSFSSLFFFWFKKTNQIQTFEKLVGRKTQCHISSPWKMCTFTNIKICAYITWWYRKILSDETKWKIEKCPVSLPGASADHF